MLATLKAFPSISSLLAVVVVTLFKQKTNSYLMLMLLMLLLFVMKFTESISQTVLSEFHWHFI